MSASFVQGVLFDLDGTLLDTAADISAALNCALAEQSLPGLATSMVRTLIGRGAPSLIERAIVRLGAAAEGVDEASLLKRFHFHSERLQQEGQIRTRVYAGVTEGLATLHALGMRLAVVTNRPAQVATRLLTRFGLVRWIDTVVGCDSSAYRKPHPQPLLLACQQLHLPPARALMVGDSQTDVASARAAGLAVICVPYGYNEGTEPRTLPCDAFVESVADLAAVLRGWGPASLAQSSPPH
jgi:phosphoglycolate phosphatase